MVVFHKFRIHELFLSERQFSLFFSSGEFRKFPLVFLNTKLLYNSSINVTIPVARSIHEELTSSLGKDYIVQMDN